MAGEDLVRPQVLLHRRESKAAGVVISQSNALATLMWIISILAVGFIVVIFSIRYKETVPSRGVLEPVSPPLELISPSRARVKDVLVTEGQRVSQGSILAVLSTEVLNGSGYRPEEISIGQLKLKISSLEKERALSKEIYLTKAEQIGSSITLIDRKLSSLNQSAKFSSERLKVSDANLKAFSTLLQTSNVSTLQHNQRQLDFYDAAQYANSIEFDKLETESKLSGLHLELKAQELEYLAAKIDYDERIQQLNYEIDGLEKNHLIKIIATGSGTVTGLAIKRGMAVLANQYLMQVSDTDNSLIATMFVSSRVIGKLHTEQSVRLSFDTFSVNQYGYYNASIVEIAGTPLDPRETSLPIQSSDQAVFRVVAELEKHYVEGSDTHPLKPGYEFTAHFVMENLSLFEFVFKPLIALRAKNK